MIRLFLLVRQKEIYIIGILKQLILLHILIKEKILLLQLCGILEKKNLCGKSLIETAFILQGDTKAEEILNTDTSWKCIQDTAYSPLQPQLTYTYYAVGATEKVDMNVYPKAWTSLNFDDKNWINAHEIFNGIPKNVNHWSTGWMLIPRQIPMMELTQQRLQSIRQKNINADENFLQGNHPIKIPAHTTAHILFDQSFETTAFPVLKFSEGKNADISLTYAEALFKNEADSIDWRAQNQKGNRNEIEGKHIVGDEG